APPARQPAGPGDLLTPRNQPPQPPRMLILQDTPATTPTTAPAPTTTANTEMVLEPATQPAPEGAPTTAPTIVEEREGRYIIGPDGRPMFVGNPAATNPSMPAGTPPAVAQPPTWPSTQGFAFN